MSIFCHLRFLWAPMDTRSKKGFIHKTARMGHELVSLCPKRWLQTCKGNISQYFSFSALNKLADFLFYITACILERSVFSGRGRTSNHLDSCSKRIQYHLYLCPVARTRHHIFIIQRVEHTQKETGSSCPVWVLFVRFAFRRYRNRNDRIGQRGVSILCPSTGNFLRLMGRLLKKETKAILLNLFVGFCHERNLWTSEPAEIVPLLPYPVLCSPCR